MIMRVHESWSSTGLEDSSVKHSCSPVPTNDCQPEDNTRSLPFTFKVLSLTGVWLPSNWESQKFLKIAYQMFSAFIVLSTYISVALQVTLLISNDFKVSFFADIMFTLLTALSVCFKMMHFLVRRRQVTQLREMLEEECCMPMDHEERQMQRKTNEITKKFTISSNFIGQMTLFFHIATPMLAELSHRKLPFRVWLPYDIRDGWNYWITYCFQVVPMIASILVNVTSDVIFCGFVLQACTQMNFLMHRLNQLPDIIKSRLENGLPVDELQRSSLKKLAVHHDFIIKYAKKVTRTFDVIIVEQYIASVLLFSVIVYEFSMGDNPTLQNIMAIGYIICVTSELFAYCWFGNEITLKSLEFGDEINKIDWSVLSKESKKSLIFIMLRSSKPITMSYGDVVVLNIDSFKTIMKITYSAFNLMKNSTET